MIGLALYSKNKRMFIFEVEYEFADTRFVGFRGKYNPYYGEFYEIKVKDGIYKVYRLDLKKESRENAPVGKQYTQLPGGGGAYKVTRGYTNISEMMKNPTVKKVLDKFFGLNEVRKVVRKKLKESKKKQQNISFLAASVEELSEIEKLEKIIRNNIPDGWVRCEFKNGSPDYHMTIRLGDSTFHTKKNLVNQDVELKITGIGRNKTAMAFREDGDMYTDNRDNLKHLTVAFNKKNGGLPQDSNNIVEWVKIKPIKIKAVIRQFDQNKEKVKGISLRSPSDEVKLDERGSPISPGHFVDSAAAAGVGGVFPQEKDNEQ